MANIEVEKDGYYNIVVQLIPNNESNTSTVNLIRLY